MSADCYNKATIEGEYGKSKGVRGRMCLKEIASTRGWWESQGTGGGGGGGAGVMTIISFPSPPTAITVAHKSVFANKLQWLYHSSKLVTQPATPYGSLRWHLNPKTTIDCWGLVTMEIGCTTMSSKAPPQLPSKRSTLMDSSACLISCLR